jgi:hypothetical protein
MMTPWTPRTVRAAALAIGVGLVIMQSCASAGSGDRSIRFVAADRLSVTTPAGAGAVPIYSSRAWERPQPDVSRAVVLFHGLHARDVFVGKASALGLAPDTARDAVMIAPQFLTEADASVHRVPDTTLRWRFGAMAAGGAAVGPAAVSSFEVIDALLDRLMDRARFPKLTRVILAGHSAGAQLLQRYAIVGHRARTAGERLSVRYVVASPSSYLYLGDERPTPSGDFAPFDRGRCPHFNRWKFGLHGAPAYVGPARDLERAYAAHEVIYLMAAADDDAMDAGMDQNCEAEAQGPDRLARGRAYMAYMRARHPAGLNHHLWEVPGVAHHTLQVFASPCGQAAIHDSAGCGSPGAPQSR